jgi:PAS domain S-box-containing protein
VPSPLTEIPITLAADQEPEVSNRFVDILRSHGHQVRTTRNAKATVDDIHSNPPALILLPVRLADASGFEICRCLRREERTRYIPVLFFTGGSGEQAEAIRAGASDCIPIFLSAPEVLARVQAHLELGFLRACGRASRSRASAGLPNPADGTARDEWMSLALQAGGMYAFDWDPRTDSVSRSGGAAAILGIGSSAARDTGTNFFRMVHPMDRDRLRRLVGILSPALDVYDTQFRLERADGKTISVRESGRGLFDGSGRLTRVIGIAADVTGEAAARSDLERNQGELLQLIEKLPIAVALADVHGRIEYINKRFTANFGYCLDDIAEPDAWWVQAYPDEDYRRSVVATWTESVDAAARNGDDIRPSQYRITGKDGTEHSVEVFGAVLGNRKLILFDDVTGRKRAEAALRESEERFRIMADTAHVMLWVSGTDKLCTFFNTAGPPGSTRKTSTAACRSMPPRSTSAKPFMWSTACAEPMASTAGFSIPAHRDMPPMEPLPATSGPAWTSMN